MIKINLHDGLIGDFLGSIPAVQALARLESVCCTYRPEVRELFEMSGLTPYYPAYRITREYNLDCQSAWRIAIDKDLHMTQAYFPLLGLSIPDGPVKAKLNAPLSLAPQPKVQRFMIHPFSKSLPENQRLPFSEWERLRELLSQRGYFPLYVGSANDIMQTGFYTTPMVGAFGFGLFGLPIISLVNEIRQSEGLISVISGISHIAYHLGVKNYLLDNQSKSMIWGVNPDAVKIQDDIPTLKAETILKHIQTVNNGKSLSGI